MDIEKFREQWNDQEYAKSFPELSQESPMEIIRRKQKCTSAPHNGAKNAG
jgi:hypothetical protein